MVNVWMLKTRGVSVRFRGCTHEGKLDYQRCSKLGVWGHASAENLET